MTHPRRILVGKYVEQKGIQKVLGGHINNAPRTC